VLVGPQGHLGGERLGMKAGAGGKHLVNQALRDAVAHHDEEADVLERAAELGGGGGERARPSGQVGGHVDDRDH
jgi:hypothetical protein